VGLAGPSKPLSATDRRPNWLSGGEHVYFNLPGVAVVKWDAPSKAGNITTLADARARLLHMDDPRRKAG